MQVPLSEEWMTQPVVSSEPLVKAQNPAFRDFIPAGEVRRMSNITKRALVTSLKVLQNAGIQQPDAIITGTSFGSLDYTERFLDAMVANGEQMLSPTYFMQSTHNTVSSALAIYTKTKGYNITYSHGMASFDLTLLDAWMQIRLGMIGNALVGGHEEMVESFYDLLHKTGYVGAPGMAPCGEVAVSMLLNTAENEQNLCELAGIRIVNTNDAALIDKNLDKMLEDAGMTRADISAVITGKNGNPANDKPYDELTHAMLPTTPLLRYKHIFGENHTASAFGIYAAAQCLKHGNIPSTLLDDETATRCGKADAILAVNITSATQCSLALLKKI